MKKIVVLRMVFFCLVSCNNSAEVASKADSLKERLDTTLDKAGDSAKAKGERTLEAIKEKVKEIGSKNDSIRTDSVQ